MGKRRCAGEGVAVPNLFSIKSGRLFAAICALVALVVLVGYLAMPTKVDIARATQVAPFVPEAARSTPAMETAAPQATRSVASPVPTPTPVPPIAHQAEEELPPTELRFRLRGLHGVDVAGRDFRVELVNSGGGNGASAERILATHFLIANASGEITVPNDPEATAVLVMDVQRELQIRYGSSAWARFAKVATDVRPRDGFIPLQARWSSVTIYCRILDPVPLQENESYRVVLGQFEEGFRPNDRLKVEAIGKEFEFRAEPGGQYLVEVGREDPDFPEYYSQRAITKVRASSGGEDTHVEIRFDERTTLHGTVLMLGGVPASGLRVRATMRRPDQPARFDEFGNQAISHETGDDGSWALTVPKADEVTLQVMDENGREQYFFYPRNGEPGKAYVRVETPTSQPVPKEPRFHSFELELKYAPMVRGVVKNPDGSPSADALVATFQRNVTNRLGSTTTDEQGKFELFIPVTESHEGPLFVVGWGEEGLGATEFRPDTLEPILVTLSPPVTVELPLHAGMTDVVISVRLDIASGPAMVAGGFIGEQFGIKIDFLEGDRKAVRVSNLPAGISTIECNSISEEVGESEKELFRVTPDGKAVLIP